MASKMYPSGLTDGEWELLEPHLPAPKRRGRPRVHRPREILDAVFYVLKTGCRWRMLLRDFPPRKTVFHYFGRWRIDGIWERMNGPSARPSRSCHAGGSRKRTFAWISHNQRMSKDYERLCSTEEAFIHAAMTRPMVRRPARGNVATGGTGR